MKFNLFDHVRLKTAIPEQHLKVGQNGAIVAVHDRPVNAYEVEFCDASGATVAQIALSDEQIELVESELQ